MSSEWHLDHLEGLSLGKERPGRSLRGWRVLYPGRRTWVQTPSPLVKLDVAANVPLPLQGHSLPWCSSFLYSSLPCFPDNSGLTLIPFRSPWASKRLPKTLLMFVCPAKNGTLQAPSPVVTYPTWDPTVCSMNSHSFVYVCVLFTCIQVRVCALVCWVYFSISLHITFWSKLSPPTWSSPIHSLVDRCARDPLAYTPHTPPALGFLTHTVTPSLLAEC